MWQDRLVLISIYVYMPWMLRAGISGRPARWLITSVLSSSPKSFKQTLFKLGSAVAV